MHILVCGGAGYIGSHMARWLAEHGHTVTVLDNLSTGHRQAVQWGALIEANILDVDTLDAVFTAQRFDAVFHFCARSLVGESVVQPYDYYHCNVSGTLNLLQAMQRHSVQRLIFSSTAAIFGHPQSAVIDEDHPKQPINPYGRSKWMMEQILADAACAYGLRAVALRYFNAAGASHDARLGESHACETHLIPNLLKSVLGNGPPLKLFGTDYPTPDGTCIRDYIHVEDLAQAHLQALNYLQTHDGFHAFNLGIGQGFSVQDVICAAAEVVGKPIAYDVAPRRAGDPAILVASSVRAQRVLGWKPAWTQLPAIIESAWRWHQQQPW